jgi:hypothetical protein
VTKWEEHHHLIHRDLANNERTNIKKLPEKGHEETRLEEQDWRERERGEEVEKWSRTYLRELSRHGRTGRDESGEQRRQTGQQLTRVRSDGRRGRCRGRSGHWWDHGGPGEV